jgi:hypothetical protein
VENAAILASAIVQINLRLAITDTEIADDPAEFPGACH